LKKKKLEIDKKLSYLCQGKQELLLTLGILPPTQHQFESFCIDCWESKVAQNPVLLIFFHGNFYDCKTFSLFLFFI